MSEQITNDLFIYDRAPKFIISMIAGGRDGRNKKNPRKNVNYLKVGEFAKSLVLPLKN